MEERDSIHSLVGLRARTEMFYRSSLLLLLPGYRRQPLPQHPNRLLVSTETGAQLGVVVTELQVPAAQIQNLLTVPGVLQTHGGRSVFAFVFPSEVRGQGLHDSAFF